MGMGLLLNVAESSASVVLCGVPHSANLFQKKRAISIGEILNIREREREREK